MRVHRVHRSPTRDDGVERDFLGFGANPSGGGVDSGVELEVEVADLRCVEEGREKACNITVVVLEGHEVAVSGDYRGGDVVVEGFA